MGIYIQHIYIYKTNCGVSFWTCWREISGDRVALFTYTYPYFTIIYPYLVIFSLNCPDFTVCSILTLNGYFFIETYSYYLAPGGGCEVLFSPCLSVCVCVRPIFWYFISRLLEEILIWNLYRILIGLYSIHTKILTFIGQRSRSQGRYIAFWRYSHITKTEP